MDTYLVDYLSSAQAWVLVGSGPSIERGYPTWERLAEITMGLVANERAGESYPDLSNAYKRKDYPMVFEQASAILGIDRLVQFLNKALKPSNPSRKIYELIAQWPVPVYLTTNFDDEIQQSLVAAREAYLPYGNSVDHLRALNPSIRGAVFKLHGDLRSKDGLILTASQYEAIDTSPGWQYWRTKMTSIFQLQRLVIVGYSLSDPHVRRVLELAKQGSNIEQPICWIAPDVAPGQCKDYLEEYNIRVVPYSNKDGQHRNLLRLLETVSDFVPKRTTLPIRQQVKAQINQNYEDNSAAPGYFVFNKLLVADDFDERRLSVIVSAIQSVLPKLKELGEFTIMEALTLAGWPAALAISKDLESQIAKRAVDHKVISFSKNKFAVHPEAMADAQDALDDFLRRKARFALSLALRIRNKFPALVDDAEHIAADIDASLITYFKEGGLTLASAIFSNGKSGASVPASIIKFIQEASSRYDDILKRQAFFTVSVDCFVRAGEPERDYLGRIAQGFFAFHTLGAFGHLAAERLSEAKNTVWLLDSSLQIRALALASSTNLVVRDCLARLHDLQIRLFTTRKLFEEVADHLWFANHVIAEHGQRSYHVFAAARGETPYTKSNVFLEGYIRWQTLGKERDWKSYLYDMFSCADVFREDQLPQESRKTIQDALLRLGIEVIDLDAWPGFVSSDGDEIQGYQDQIVGKLLEFVDSSRECDQLTDPHKKAAPEAEVLKIVQQERDGRYHVLSEPGTASDAWFVSETSMLNAIAPGGKRITWQPEAFLRFASTIFAPLDSGATERSFEILLLEFAKTGVSMLDETLIEDVFSSMIDQAELSIAGQRDVYRQTIGNKYGEDPTKVQLRLRPIEKPLAAIQLSNEMAKNAAERQKQADNVVSVTREQLAKAERELDKVQKYRVKLQRRQFERSRKGKRPKSKTK